MVGQVCRTIRRFFLRAQLVVGCSVEYTEHRVRCPDGAVQLRGGHKAVLLVSHAAPVAALADTRLSHDVTSLEEPRLAARATCRDDPEIMHTPDIQASSAV